MQTQIKFKTERIVLGIIILIGLFTLSIYLVLKPEIFIRNVFMTERGVRSIGVLCLIYYTVMFYSFIRIIPKRYALKITQTELTDNSRFESIGEIQWNEISEIKRLKKWSVEVTLKNPISDKRKGNIIKRFLLFMGNWNSKTSIIISSRFLNCSVEQLYEKLCVAHNNYKNR